MKDRAKELTLDEKIDAAFRQAAFKVIERARQTATPVIVWEDGHIVERTSDEMLEILLKRTEEESVKTDREHQ